jgi:hypothetical protein
MANLSASDRKRLAAILSMLGSSASGERENAARLAEQFRNRCGLTWADLLAMPPAPPEELTKPSPADMAAARSAARKAAWVAAVKAPNPPPPKPNPSRYSSRRYERNNPPLHHGNSVRWIRLNGWTADVRHRIKLGIYTVVLTIGFAALMSYVVD